MQILINISLELKSKLYETEINEKQLKIKELYKNKLIKINEKLCELNVLKLTNIETNIDILRNPFKNQIKTTKIYIINIKENDFKDILNKNKLQTEYQSKKWNNYVSKLKKIESCKSKFMASNQDYKQLSSGIKHKLNNMKNEYDNCILICQQALNNELSAHRFKILEMILI